mmetsp:Transcript_42867/g.69224  ORF Transcript_42867/g.69224 Transcript_42867/m.69224 type:complete len:206 (-) Transcript_42867:22-639(-)
MLFPSACRRPISTLRVMSFASSQALRESTFHMILVSTRLVSNMAIIVSSASSPKHFWLWSMRFKVFTLLLRARPRAMEMAPVVESLFVWRSNSSMVELTAKASARAAAPSSTISHSRIMTVLMTVFVLSASLRASVFSSDFMQNEALLLRSSVVRPASFLATCSMICLAVFWPNTTIAMLRARGRDYRNEEQSLPCPATTKQDEI